MGLWLQRSAVSLSKGCFSFVSNIDQRKGESYFDRSETNHHIVKQSKVLVRAESNQHPTGKSECVSMWGSEGRGRW